MSKHTPGKWRSVRFRVLAGERCVADTSDITSTLYGGTEAEAFANARLIAAAPAMYEALKTLVDCYGICKTPAQFTAVIHENGFMVEARAVLAEVEGKSNVKS